VAHELAVMPGAAVDALSAVPGVGSHQLLQQRTPEGRHCGADRQLHRGQALAGRAELLGGQRCRPFYLGRELRRDLIVEPLFSSPVPAGGAVAAGFGGRASQIASLTSTIRSDTLAKRW
jgi:hypothetical protein